MARKPSTGANLATIARELGISSSTVSRALRGAEGIHSTTRVQVMQAAKNLGYERPGTKTAALAGNAHILMALAQCSTASDQRFLSGMSRASVMLNLSILSHHVPAEECHQILDPKHQPNPLRSGMAEGLVLIHRWPREVALHLSERWPTVSIIHQYPGTLIDHVGIDDRSGIALLVEHLHASGLKRIGFFGYCREMSWARSRLAAFMEAQMSLDLAYHPKDTIAVTLEEAAAPVYFPEGDWTTAIRKQMKEGVDAWVCASSGTAQSLCRYFTSQGIRMPEDVSVTGYHASMNMLQGLPVISSTLISDEELGAAALRRLLHRLQHPDESQRSILLPSKFLQGETTPQAK